MPRSHREGNIWRLLDVHANTGMQITESFAMWPGSSVSGLYFAHPESRYFSLGKIERDQVADYHQRKGMTVAEVERWLGQISTTTLSRKPSNPARTGQSAQTQAIFTQKLSINCRIGDYRLTGDCLTYSYLE